MFSVETALCPSASLWHCPAGHPDISGAGREDTLLQPLNWGVTHSQALVSGSYHIMGGPASRFIPGERVCFQI